MKIHEFENERGIQGIIIKEFDDEFGIKELVLTNSPADDHLPGIVWVTSSKWKSFICRLTKEEAYVIGKKLIEFSGKE